VSFAWVTSSWVSGITAMVNLELLEPVDGPAETSVNVLGAA